MYWYFSKANITKIMAEYFTLNQLMKKLGKNLTNLFNKIGFIPALKLPLRDDHFI
jgi:hypothetical protein